ncbi:isoprenylcysteine carboxylmethyltransferase family protein [Arthrobacter livingstonensis]|uniref:Isoprenylcysteine carboxylmethyltransferase family protein n=1 Tax=Arthrobacter livingstonensis TaxID=670078 RepID=A0A2V5LCM3_9MICC|nr:isoprenylcysteine carboxylmethyltransferase family protein [Arthrobacter livingstonensis]PYI69421.1 isoprenylcysteine carboxylmethyltransferase family protein [Arthrobacter livingstonensis]
MSKHEGIPVPPVAMAAAVATQRLTRKGQKARRVRRAAAAALAAGSASMLLATLVAFLRRGTTLDPTAPANASVLVTGGSNGISRNPMYVGLAGMLLAHAVSRGSWRALLPVGGFVLVMDRFQIASEEQALRIRFGDEYLRYCASTPRWLDRRSLNVIKWR